MSRCVYSLFRDNNQVSNSGTVQYGYIFSRSYRNSILRNPRNHFFGKLEVSEFQLKLESPGWKLFNDIEKTDFNIWYASDAGNTVMFVT